MHFQILSVHFPLFIIRSNFLQRVSEIIMPKVYVKAIRYSTCV